METNNEDRILIANSITKSFGGGSNRMVAVNDVSIELTCGKTIAVVGESGSGKTTLSKILLGFLKPDSGDIYFENNLCDFSSNKNKKAYWREVQAIFQDPFSSFNMFKTVDTFFLECFNPLNQGKLSLKNKVGRITEACSFVGLNYEELIGRYPFEMSGGQLQRVMIARIYLIKPKILIADEPTSMVDACSRANIMEMLLKLQRETNMAILLITHDIVLAYNISERINVMQKGHFVESGKAKEIIFRPKEEYTKQLINDIPQISNPWSMKRNSNKAIW
ncbi:ATP-binding cassette domain-containing protein [Tissierella praeacuta]|uniref:ABC transporter ATP-binding protein n=1 Tax=Tissierella praeacuta TaxID=43131 RepID=UPI00333E63C1